MKPQTPLTEAEARARLAAGKPLPLAWLWLLGAAQIEVTNAGKPGKTLEVKVYQDEDVQR